MANPGRGIQIGREIGLWAAALAGAAVMLMAGSGKIGAGEPWLSIFADWGYPAWFLRVVGIVQVAGGLLILVPRVAAYGAALLLITMGGALATELALEPEFGPVIPGIFVLLFLLLFLGRRKAAIGPLGGWARNSSPED